MREINEVEKNMKIDTENAVRRMHAHWAIECSEGRLESYTNLLDKIPSDLVKQAIKKLFNETDRKRIPTPRDLFVTARAFKLPEDMHHGVAKKHWADIYHEKIMSKRDAKMPDWKARLTECETPKEKMDFLEYLDKKCEINIASASSVNLGPMIERATTGGMQI